MNHPLSDTNCNIPSTDLDLSDSNSVTVTSSNISIASDTHDKKNGPVTSQSARAQALDSIGLIGAVAAVIIVLLGIIITVLVVIVLLVKKRYCSTGACRK